MVLKGLFWNLERTSGRHAPRYRATLSRVSPRDRNFINRLIDVLVLLLRYLVSDDGP